MARHRCTSFRPQSVASSDRSSIQTGPRNWSDCYRRSYTDLVLQRSLQGLSLETDPPLVCSTSFDKSTLPVPGGPRGPSGVMAKVSPFRSTRMASIAALSPPRPVLPRMTRYPKRLNMRACASPSLERLKRAQIPRLRIRFAGRNVRPCQMQRRIPHSAFSTFCSPCTRHRTVEQTARAKA